MSISSTQDVAQRLWLIRRLLRAGVVDRRAARTSVEIFVGHPNARIARLAAQTLADLDHRAPIPSTVLEFAR
jgi:hypothetical protein